MSLSELRDDMGALEGGVVEAALKEGQLDMGEPELSVGGPERWELDVVSVQTPDGPRAPDKRGVMGTEEPDALSIDFGSDMATKEFGCLGEN